MTAAVRPVAAAGPPAPADRRALLPPIVLLLFLIAGPLFATVRSRILPARFLADGAFIQLLAQRPAEHGGAVDSYAFTASVYRALGLASDGQLAAVVSLAPVFACWGLLLVRMRRTPVPLTALALLVAGLGLSCVYFADYSKDAIALVVVALVVAAPDRLPGLVVPAVAALGYGLVARQYWLAIAAAFLGLSLLFARVRPTVPRAALAALAATLALSIAIAVVLHADPDAIRFDSNVTRLGSADASTIIPAFVPGGGLAAGTLDNLLVLASLVVPLPLARLGPVYAVLALAILAIWVVFGRAVHRLARASERRPSTVRALAFVTAYVAVQAGFEPDYGSYLRHLTVVLPLIAMVVWRATERTAPVPRRSAPAPVPALGRLG